MQGPKRSFLLSIVVYETLCGHDIDVWDRLNKFCIWVKLRVQRRLCPIFVRNVGSSDIHECFRGLTGSQRTPGFGASHGVFCVMFFLAQDQTDVGQPDLVVACTH